MDSRSDHAVDDFAWRPDAAVRARARLTAFLSRVGVASFGELHAWSVDDVGAFTAAVLEHLEIQFQRPYRQVLDLSRGRPWARWCVDGRLNITATCLDHHLAAGHGGRPALIWEGEEGLVRTLTYAALAANALGWLAHRQWHRSLLGMTGPTLVLLTLYPLWKYSWSTYMLYTGLGLMLLVAGWDIYSPASRKCDDETCEV